jgi:anti-sigma-K factor RskA
MNIAGKPELRDRLAAEYALGTLRDGARRRFESWLRTDAELRALVTKWHEHLVPLTESLLERAPHPRVWEAITARIPALQPPPAPPGWWNSLSFWRGLALATTAAAVFAIGMNVLRTPGSAPAQLTAALPSIIATITDQKTGEPLAFLMVPSNGDELVVKLAASVAVPDDKTLQLWMAPEKVAEGAPTLASVGLVSASAKLAAVPLRLTAENLATLKTAKGLGLSLEPLGGSPQPTQVLGFGKWTKLTA